jgi:hypothetical protein
LVVLEVCRVDVRDLGLGIATRSLTTAAWVAALLVIVIRRCRHSSYLEYV